MVRGAFRPNTESPDAENAPGPGAMTRDRAARIAARLCSVPTLFASRSLPSRLLARPADAFSRPAGATARANSVMISLRVSKELDAATFLYPLGRIGRAAQRRARHVDRSGAARLAEHKSDVADVPWREHEAIHSAPDAEPVILRGAVAPDAPSRR